MRCAKCGYTSFDYLSVCEQCSADLTGDRQKLGLLALKPAMPFFLEPLLQPDADDPDEAAIPQPAIEPFIDPGAAEEGGSSAEPPDSSAEPAARIPELSPEWADGVGGMAAEVPDQALASGRDAAVTSDDEIPVIEFSDDDLEAYMEVEPSIPEKQLHPSESQAAESGGDELSDQNMVIELSEDDLEDLFLELEGKPEQESPPGKRPVKK